MRMISMLALTALGAMTMAQLDPNRTVAVINGEEIKAAEYYRRMEFLGGVGKQVGNSFAEFPPGFLTIEQIITERLILQLAKEKGLLPTDAEVEAEVKQVETNEPTTLANWIATGQTRSEFASMTRYTMAQFRLTTRGINITDAEVEKFYKDNPTLFTAPKQVQLRIVVVNSDDAQKAVDAELSAGKKFEDVVRAHSIDLSKSNGGDFGFRSWEELSEQARKALESVQAGQNSAWVVSGPTRVKFHVVSVIAPKKQALDAATRRLIRREQMLTKGRIANNLSKEMAEFRRKAAIDIKEKSFNDAYRKFVDTLIGGG